MPTAAPKKPAKAAKAAPVKAGAAIAAKAKAKPKSAQDLLRTIRDKHTDEKEGDLSYIYGDSKASNFTAPKLFFSSGLTLLDAALGNGGFGTGRICEVYGPNRTGKSELVQKIMRQFLEDNPDGVCFYWDQEGAVDDKMKKMLPAHIRNRISWEWAPYAERCFAKIIEIAKDIKETAPNTPILIIIDSIAGLETKEEMDKKLDEAASMAAMARLLSRAFRKLKPVLQETNAFLLVTNQIRHKPNQPAYVDDESPGGEALKFWADYRIKTTGVGNFWFKKAGDEDEKTPPDGIKIRYKTIKNKLAPPLRTVEMILLFAPKLGSASGLSDSWSVFEQLKRTKDLAAKGGRYFLKLPHPMTIGNPAAKTPPEELSFPREDWAPLWVAEKPRIMTVLDRWVRAMMMESDEGVEEVEDHDFVGGPRPGPSGTAPRRSLLPSLQAPPTPAPPRPDPAGVPLGETEGVEPDPAPPEAGEEGETPLEEDDASVEALEADAASARSES